MSRITYPPEMLPKADGPAEVVVVRAQGAEWVDAKTPPPEDLCDCIVMLSDNSEQAGIACFDPDGTFVGWMFDAGLEPSENDLIVVAWRYG